MSKRSTAFGNIRKLPSGRYQARYRRDGHYVTAPDTFTSRTAARSWLDIEQARMITGQWQAPELPDAVPTLAEYAGDWLAARKLAASTRRAYESSMRRWVNREIPRPTGGTINLGAMRLDRITAADVRAWHAAVTEASRASALGVATHCRRRATSHPARVWAQRRGLEVADTGKLPDHIRRAWEEAGCPVPVRGRTISDEQARNAGSAATAQAYRTVHAIIATAVDDELIPRNPVRVRGAASSPTQDRQPATPEQVRQLAELFPPRLAAAVIVAAYSGLRSGELFGLAREHVDLDTGALHVRRALLEAVGPDGAPVYGTTKTVGSRRTVYLPAFVVDVLREHMNEYTARHDSAPIFTSNDGRTPVRRNTITQYMRKHREAIGLPGFRWHDLRHTGATLAYAVGASVPDVQARLGHTTMRAATIYAHSADRSGELLAAKLDEAFGDRAKLRPNLRAVG